MRDASVVGRGLLLVLVIVIVLVVPAVVVVVVPVLALVPRGACSPFGNFRALLPDFRL